MDFASAGSVTLSPNAPSKPCASRRNSLAAYPTTPGDGEVCGRGGGATQKPREGGGGSGVGMGRAGPPPGSAATPRPPGWAAFHRSATAPRGRATSSRHWSRICSGVMARLRWFEEAVEEEGADLGRERARVVAGAHERPGRDAVRHAEEEIGRRQELVAGPPVRVELAQDPEPALDVVAALGRDLRAARLGQELPVAVDDLERLAVAEAEVEVRLDQGE